MTETESLKQLIATEYTRFVLTQGHEPKFACVVIKYDGEDEEATDLIKVSGFDLENTENDPDDDHVLFYADGVDELIRLVDEDIADFKITDINGFTDSY